MVNKLTIGYKDRSTVIYVCDQHLEQCVNLKLRSGYSTMSLSSESDQTSKCQFCEEPRFTNESK